MPTFSKVFKLDKTQAELDFVDVHLEKDNLLFIDPFALGRRLDNWSHEAALTLGNFFQEVVTRIKNSEDDLALELLMYLHEPNETRLGYSRGRPQGAGVGSEQAEELFDALKQSSAVRTGFISSLEEAELMVEGIGRDKISDLTTNVIRAHLIEYTKSQCELYDIPTQEVALPPCFDVESMSWEEKFANLPVYKSKPILLVPKAIVRYAPAYQNQKYYQHHVLNFLKAQELANPQSRLVKVLRLKKGRIVRKLTKKTLKEHFPNTKNYLFEFSQKYPQVLRAYRQQLEALERSGSTAELREEDQSLIAAALATALKSIKPGDDGATQYHRLMIGIAEFLFYPSLLHPKKEREIHDGRKRIDIVMENGATGGPFFTLPNAQRIPCLYVPFECKNYGREVGNPELDQIAGRFSLNRGKVGFLCCRSFADRATFIERCRDTIKDDRGLIIPLDDKTVLGLLELIEKGERSSLDTALSDLIAEVLLS
jgi:alkylhydroperoxidase/carboxymuconolactone decarboxylase family protein YurZ